MVLQKLLQFLGWCSFGFIGLFCPRFILAILGGFYFGGKWWILFIPLAILGLSIDASESE
jgi:hypothetical protein